MQPAARGRRARKTPSQLPRSPIFALPYHYARQQPQSAAGQPTPYACGLQWPAGGLLGRDRGSES